MCVLRAMGPGGTGQVMTVHPLLLFWHSAGYDTLPLIVRLVVVPETEEVAVRQPARYKVRLSCYVCWLQVGLHGVRHPPCRSGLAAAGTTCASLTLPTLMRSSTSSWSSTGCPWTCTWGAQSTRCCTCCMHASGTRWAQLAGAERPESALLCPAKLRCATPL